MRRASCACHEFLGFEMWIHDPTTHGRSCLAVAIAVLEGCRGAAIKQRHDEILNLAVGLCQHELCYISVAAEDGLRDNRITASPIGSWMAQGTIISVCTVFKCEEAPSTTKDSRSWLSTSQRPIWRFGTWFLKVSVLVQLRTMTRRLDAFLGLMVYPEVFLRAITSRPLPQPLPITAEVTYKQWGLYEDAWCKLNWPIAKQLPLPFFSAIDLHVPAVVLSWDLPPQN